MALFVHPPDVRFTCSRCGDCCRTWDVMISPRERKALEGVDWSERADDLVDLKPTVGIKVPGMTGQRRLRRRDDGSCIYLGEQNQCRLHEHFGDEAKPLMCRLYPFGFYPIGDRVAVDVAFSCRAVAEDKGKKLDGREPEWTRLVRAAHAARIDVEESEVDLESAVEDDREHRLRDATRLPAELVWELEHDLLGLLDNREMALFDRVRAVLQYGRIATMGDPTLPTAAALRQAMAKGIPLQMQREPSKETLDRTQRAVFFQWLFLALNPPPSRLQELPPELLEQERRKRLGWADRYKISDAHPLIDDRELGVTFEEVVKVGSGVLRAPGGGRGERIEHYLKAKILGQRFLLQGGEELPFVEALAKFLLVYPMILWTAKALAAERGAPEVEDPDVRSALRWIDRTAGRLPMASLPKKAAKASDFVLLETPVVEAAANDILHGR